MEEVPRRISLAPLASPCFVLCLLTVETEELLDYQGRAGIISIARWNLRPVIFGGEFFGLQNALCGFKVSGLCSGQGDCSLETLEIWKSSRGS